MKKKYFELLISFLLLSFVLLLVFLPIYYVNDVSVSFFLYCEKAGADILSYGGGILLSLLAILSIVKAIYAFRYGGDSEKNEQVNFALYSIWIVLGLGYAMVCFAKESLIAFGLGLGLSLLGLLIFFLDFHFYGQD